MSHDRATSKATLLSYGGSPWDPCRNSTKDGSAQKMLPVGASKVR